jgi:hypothetical protein
MRGRATSQDQYQAPSAAANDSRTALLAADWDAPVVASIVA